MNEMDQIREKIKEDLDKTIERMIMCEWEKISLNGIPEDFKIQFQENPGWEKLRFGSPIHWIKSKESERLQKNTLLHIAHHYDTFIDLCNDKKQNLADKIVDDLINLWYHSSPEEQDNFFDQFSPSFSALLSLTNFSLDNNNAYKQTLANAFCRELTILSVRKTFA